jgi:HK97 family phage major capsid protein
MPANTQDVTLDQVADFLFAQMFNDPKIKDVPANERSAYVAQRFNALAEDVAEKKAEAKVAGLRAQYTELQEAFAELEERTKRGEQWHASEHGYHRGIDGTLQPSVSAKTADTLVKLVRAIKTKDSEAIRAVSSGTGSEGGYALQTDVAAEILRLIPETGLYPKIARPWPITTQKVNISNVLTQMSAYWPGENAPVTDSYPGFGQVVLEAKLLAAYIPVPQTLLDDATPNLGQLFADLIRECIGKELDRVALVGKSVADGGSDAFTGLLNAANINVKVMDTGHTSFKNIGWEYLQDLQDATPEGGTEDASYILNRTMLNFMRKQKDADGQPIWQRPADGEPGTIMGRPYNLTDRMPSYSAATQVSKRSVLFGAWKKWAIFGNRQELAIATSDVAGNAFVNYQLAIRGITRVAIASFGKAFSVLETAAT